MPGKARTCQAFLREQPHQERKGDGYSGGAGSAEKQRTNAFA
jgi:hypothetical protein